jgi:P4 family phage/plasmid primase-like protien
MTNRRRIIEAAGVNLAADAIDLSQYAPPVPPEGLGDLPDLDGRGTNLWRGDEAELADLFLQCWLGRHSVAVNGEVWQWQPEARGWVRLSADLMVQMLSVAAGARILNGVREDGSPRHRPLALTNSRLRGAIAIATSKLTRPETEGPWWKADRDFTTGLCQFRDRAVMVTQEGPGRLTWSTVEPSPDLRVRAARVLPAKFQGMPDDLEGLRDVCPEFHQVCSDWWGHHGGEELAARQRAVLEFLGASLLGMAPMMARAVMLYGEGGTGKSTLIELLTRWCQPQAVASVTPQDMGVNRFASAQLDGALLNVVDDLPAEPIKDAGAWKSSITGGRMGVERKGRDGYTIHPRAGHLYAGNRLPVAVRANTGFWRRWLVVEYDRVFAGTQHDRDVLTALLDETPDLVCFALRAFLDTGGKGGRGYTLPACHARMLHEWETISDSVTAFWADAVEVLEPGRPRADGWPRALVYRSYRGWCEEGGRKPVAAAEFYRRVIALGGQVAKSNGQRILNLHVRTETALPADPSGGAW